jgi:DNA-binding protein YbaB
MVAALSQLSVDATSPDGAVSVSVNTDGVLTRLRLNDAVSGMSPDEIADAVLRTYVQAQRESAQRSGELMAPLGNAGYLMDRLRWRLSFKPDFQVAAEPAPPSAPAAPRRKRPDAENAVLKDRTSDPAPTTRSGKPAESDDEYYEQGLRYDSAW